MEEKVLLNQFETRIVQTKNQILVQKRPWGLVGLGLGILVLSLLVHSISGSLRSELLTLVLGGFSYLIGILGGVFLLIGFASLIPKLKNMLTFDLQAKQIHARNKAYSFSSVGALKIVPLGNSFMVLQIHFSPDSEVLRIITLPVSKLEILEKLKNEFEQILTVKEQKLEFSSASPENQVYSPFPSQKQALVFTILLGFLWTVICYFVFPGLVVRSRMSNGTEIPFWSLGFLIMAIGVFNFFKKKKNKS